MTADKKIEEIINQELTRMWESGARAEQERIIALLQQDICPDYTLDCCDGWCGAYVGAIKLIKEAR